MGMQCGFCMLEVGTVRIKNTKNILVKNILDACIGAILYWGFGYGLSYGMQKDTSADNASFAGNDLFFYSGTPDKHMFDAADDFGTLAGSYNFAGYAHFFFNFTFAATAASIVSGAVAERCGMWAYFLYSAVLSGFVYPIVAHWVWAQPGWMCAWPRRLPPRWPRLQHWRCRRRDGCQARHRRPRRHYYRLFPVSKLALRFGYCISSAVWA